VPRFIAMKINDLLKFIVDKCTLLIHTLFWFDTQFFIAIIALIVIWGVQKKDILLTVSSITTVIGVAMFAQWSILSNITSGIILFFFFPFKIGDVIKIHDKDFPIQAEIEDINAFHVNLKTIDGERITYPNNLLLQKGISIIDTKIDDKEYTD